jgi:hypothetical protein
MAIPRYRREDEHRDIQITLFGGNAGNAFLACGKESTSRWRRSSNSEYLDLGIS